MLQIADQALTLGGGLDGAQIIDIGAANERAVAGAFNDHRAHLVAAGEVEGGLPYLGGETTGQSVALGHPVENDMGDRRVVTANLNNHIAHFQSSALSSGSAPWARTSARTSSPAAAKAASSKPRRTRLVPI